MTIHAALFDFSGTLFRLEHPELASNADLMRALTAPVGIADDMDPELVDAWYRRDLDPDVHRWVHVRVLNDANVPDAETLYDQLIDAESWQPYPDTKATLEHLADVPVAVVSNIGWDIRPVFERFGLTHLVDEFVLSYEEGVIKPDPKIFTTACERLGVDPRNAVMVGDSEEADGGAEAVGCAFRLVNPVPTSDRPTALLDVARTIPV
ncbi:HAD family hydrolase [Lentzea nigeriaca]|uniref:HAD family hydrolase n=1 Tax=Lentzea nigeriaca TaxID=1128665 RepID=UPI001956A6CF|nr:HAD-IA family hydrolase [Lentzea nigeriaca]MBM7858005.1 HAD superfamily hydrolase (TIGR01509 family) [Lentzea nigeriaca]